MGDAYELVTLRCFFGRASLLEPERLWSGQRRQTFHSPRYPHRYATLGKLVLRLAPTLARRRLPTRRQRNRLFAGSPGRSARLERRRADERLLAPPFAKLVFAGRDQCRARLLRRIR